MIILKLNSKLIFSTFFLLLILNLGMSSFSFEDTQNTKYPKIINVPYVDQSDIIHGCESVSSVMVLNYYGYNIDKKTFTDDYLIQRDWEIDENDNILGPDPNAAYVGSQYISDGLNCGFGCYANATAKSIDKVLNGSHRTQVTTGTNLSDLIHTYIDNDIPVLVWATIDMKKSYSTLTWTINYVDDNSLYEIGDKFTWLACEHCLVLVGYDKDKYYFNDPYKHHGCISYAKDLVEKRFKELGDQSVVILPQ